jgi:hypothetical protein
MKIGNGSKEEKEKEVERWLWLVGNTIKMTIILQCTNCITFKITKLLLKYGR